MTNNTWICEIHGITCSYGHPCYECKKELANPEIIEKDKLPLQAKREKNARPRKSMIDK
jgi:hypothetical protein